ncbi:uncharacterized protein TM35_000101630 [Trypanosoma theileri]|uniref:Uncharacterized protein n=1 Tax=Trypanosoma theileri TaxID=67003 RepID=A0A1X0NYY9_9TRYP|nr:uncharacterized protein TM35_000101630 [Trypanosoma theileri]ORC89895.1 hypothetical protein TM35_000101630 [Trypanosoma theileri]
MKAEDTLSNSGTAASLPPVTSGTSTLKAANGPSDNAQTTNDKNNSKNQVGKGDSTMGNQANYDGGLTPLKGDDNNDDNKKRSSSRKLLTHSSTPDILHSKKKSGSGHTGSNNACPSPFPVGKGRSNMHRGGNNYWRIPLKRRSIGHGTVGLYQNQTNDPDVPEGAKACINGTLVVGNTLHVNKVRDYMQWREKHSALFSTMREQDEKERVESRRRRLVEAERQRELEEGEYAAAVTRMRHRGWSILGDTPRPVDHARLMQIQAQREAVRAECEGVAIRKMMEATKLRENIAQDLALQKETREKEQQLVRDAARAEREQWSAFREHREAELRERAGAMRAERDAAREYNRACLTLDAATWRQYVTSARDRVQARSATPDSSHSPRDWRCTFRSPLRVPQNAADEAVRRAWTAELLDLRRAVAAASVARVRRERAAAAAEGGAGGAAYRENCARAEALRVERAALQARREAQAAEEAREHRALAEALADGRRRRVATLEALRAKRWEAAEAQRQNRSPTRRGRESPELESPLQEL